jgi:hypothetical protein
MLGELERVSGSALLATITLRESSSVSSALAAAGSSALPTGLNFRFALAFFGALDILREGMDDRGWRCVCF